MRRTRSWSHLPAPALAVVACLAGAACATSNPPGGGAPDADPSRPDGGPDEDAPDADVTQAERSCATRFAIDPAGDVTGVEVAGEWDWDTRTPLTDADGDGTYDAALELAEGLWAYKLVLTRPGGAVEWILDPNNPYRTYSEGVENSAARVDDCTAPLLELVDHRVTGDGSRTEVRVLRGAGGAAVGAAQLRVARRFEATEVDVPAEDVTFDGATVTVALDGLPAGKHTLVVEAEGARPVLVPFWIEDAPFDWRDALVYMVMTDRLQNGDPSNDPAPAAGADPGADYLGGDLRGVTAAIENGVFDELGVRALWLSPWVENTPRVHDDGGHGVTGYHGYWPVTARAVDPRLGTEADLDALVTAAHRAGIRVLMDFVINHVHEDHEYVDAHPGWFRTGCQCGTPGCDWTTRRLDCSFRPYLPDVDWTHRDAGEQMIADALWWIERFDLDGLRVDAVKHVEDLAIINLSTRVHETFERGGTEYFLLGETAMGWAGHDLSANLPEYATIARYIGPFGLSGQFDFVLYHATAYRVWADDQYGMLHLDYWTRQSHAQYPADAVMTPFVGSHDSERLITLATYGSGNPIVHRKWASEGLPAAPTTDAPFDRAAIALTWMLTVPGAPLLYYGDEYGEHGGADPDNRHMWVAPGGRNARQNNLHDRVARAGRLRQELLPLRRGDYRPLTVTEDVLSFARTAGDEVVIVVIRRAGTGDAVVTVPPELGLSGTLVDRLDPGGRTVTVTGGQVVVPMAGRSAAVLVPAAATP